MKNLLPIVAWMLLPLSTYATILTGKQANKEISGASIVRMQENTLYPQFVQFATGKELDPTAIEKWFNTLTEDANYGLNLISKDQDELKQEHWTYSITYNGIPSEYEKLKAHLKNGKVFRINGEFALESPSTSVPAINEQQGLQYALAAINAQTYKWEIPAEEHHLKLETGNSLSTYYPTGDLVYVRKNALTSQPKQLAWRYNIYAQEPLSRTLVFVDATTGEVIFQENLIHHADAHGTAVTKYSGIRSIVADSLSPTSFRLQETGRGNGIITLNMQNSTLHSSAVNFVDTDNFWNNINFAQDEVAGDAHWGAEMTYDYFMLEHNRNSIDGNGFALYSYVHYDYNFANAFWDGQRMTYGDGDGFSITPLTSLDIAGHEIAHGLTSFSANLIYQNESGALNESFSDIFGTAIEYYGKPNTANWLIGEDIGQAIRSMSNPALYGDPNCYNGNNWYIGPLDNGGVHTNSGVQNYWFYLLSIGGSGVNDLSNFYNVNGIGIDAAAQVAFRNLTVYLTAPSVYNDARFYAILSAIDLFGNCSPEVEAVTNAWYAVGVGNQYSSGVTADFSASSTYFCQTPANVQFTNFSTNGLSYFWDFGDGNTSTLANPTHTYFTAGTYDVKLVVDGGACGMDSLILSNYVEVDNNGACDVILPVTGMAPTQNSCSGRLFDSGGEFGIYSPYSDATITIQPLNATSIDVSIPFVDIEGGTGCPWDKLLIFDGPSTNYPLLLELCGNSTPSTITSSGGAITIQFISDGSVEGDGFMLDWTCTQSNIPPVSDFSVLTNDKCAGEIQFEDLSTNQPDQWLWNFGDGNTSTLQHPLHAYASPGTYTVSLEASNSYGSHVETKAGIVTITKPNPKVVAQEACIGDTVVLEESNTTEIRWFTNQQDINPVHEGYSYEIPSIQNNQTLYYEQLIKGDSFDVGLDIHSNPFVFFSSAYVAMEFDVYEESVLDSVTVNALSGGQTRIVVYDSLGTEIASRIVNLTAGIQQVYLGFNLPVGLRHFISLDQLLYLQLESVYGWYLPSISSNGAVKISQSISPFSQTTDTYYGFYNWKMRTTDCYSERKAVNVTIRNEGCDVGIANSSWQNAITVYPNPTKSNFTIDLADVPAQEIAIQLVNIVGQPVLTTQSSGKEQVLIETDQLAKGTYWLIISGKDVQVKQAIVVQ